MIELNAVTWPTHIWYGMSIISVPIYIIVVICLIKLRYVSRTYTTTFYTLLLQHRFITIVFPSSRFTHAFQEAKSWQTISLYWSIPIIFEILILKSADAKFDGLQDMAIVVDKSVINYNTTLALIVSSFTCLLCATFYVLIAVSIKKKTGISTKKFQKEKIIAIQILILLVAFLGVFVYFGFQNYFSRTGNTGPVFFMRSIYPLPSGVLSYINPFCILILNRDFTTHVARIITCNTLKKLDTTVSTVQSTSDLMENLRAVNWPTYVWYGMSIVSVPTYIVVLISLIKLRKFSKAYRTTFYTLLIQHGFADLSTMFFYFLLFTLRKIQTIRQLYFDYQEYFVAEGTYNFTYYFLAVRCFGINLLTFQRFIIIAAPSSKITHIIQEASTPSIAFFYWSFPTIFSVLFLSGAHPTFDSVEDMAIVVDKWVITRNTTMALAISTFTCLACTTIYILIACSIQKRTGNSSSQSFQKEKLIAIQIYILVIAFFGIFFYFAFQNYFSRIGNSGPVFFMRSLYPLPSGVLSYINPFCTLFLNREFTTQVKKIITFRNITVSFADLFTMFFYFILFTLRKIEVIRQFYYDYQSYYIAPATYNFTYYFLYIRCSGIILLTLQRVVFITVSFSKVANWMREMNKWKVVLIYWLTPTIISIVVLKDVDIVFDDINNMDVIVDKEIIMDGPVFFMRSIYPIPNGVLSYLKGIVCNHSTQNVPRANIR
ncbi:unnamed protein product [Caenorhabditis angaria]|uniref:G-protein coupled receptors family 1 profile domain-containing protein n=1 Tax=Caenorhabditis angaria TaxID=860376 RepID=A0A9P1IUM9_9PELO|nr:unnamed protein product [Caenorhabditis angaria]